MATLTVENLIVNKKCLKTNRHINILKAVSATFDSGKVNAIMGPNGCGKSTLLSAIFGLCDSNTIMAVKITLDGKERDLYSWIDSISYLEQNGYLIPDQIVISCFDFIIDIMNIKQKTYNSLSEYSSILDTLQIKDDLLYKKVSELSGGERHRVHIALELIMNKKIIMLDEPASDLDSYLATNLIVFLNEYARKNNTILIITIHQPSKSIYDEFDNLLFMKDGRVVYNGPSAEAEKYLASLGILKPENSVFTEFLFEAFYCNSKRVDFKTKAATSTFMSKIERNTDIITNATKNMTNGKNQSLMAKCNPRSVLTISKRIAVDFFSLSIFRLAINQLAFIMFTAIILILRYSDVLKLFPIEFDPLFAKLYSDTEFYKITKNFIDNAKVGTHFLEFFLKLRLEIILSCLVIFYSYYGMIKKDRGSEFQKYICKGVITKPEILFGYALFVFIYSFLYILAFTILSNLYLESFCPVSMFSYMLGDICKIVVFCALSTFSYILIESICDVTLKKSKFNGLLHLFLFALSASYITLSLTAFSGIFTPLISFLFSSVIGPKLKNILSWFAYFFITNMFSSAYFRYFLLNLNLKTSEIKIMDEKILVNDICIGNSDQFNSMFPDYDFYRTFLIEKFLIFKSSSYNETIAFMVSLVISVISSAIVLYYVFSRRFTTRFNLKIKQ